MFKKPDMVAACSCKPSTGGRDKQTQVGLAGQLANLVYLVSGRAGRDPVLRQGRQWTKHQRFISGLQGAHISTHMHPHKQAHAQYPCLCYLGAFL